jgi:hypothetical protein
MIISIDFGRALQDVKKLQRLPDGETAADGLALFSDGEYLILLQDGEHIAKWQQDKLRTYMTLRSAALSRAKRRMQQAKCKHDYNSSRICRRCGHQREKLLCCKDKPGTEADYMAGLAYPWSTIVNGTRVSGYRFRKRVWCRRRKGHDGRCSWERA